MPRIVSVSLGSSTRDHSTELKTGKESYQIERRGTDGNLKKAMKMIQELDGEVAAIGLGGIDLYLYAGKKRYCIKDALKLKECATKTAVVDGSGLKITLERKAIQYVCRQKKLLKKGTKVLMMSAVDRWGMAEAIWQCECNVIFGDFLYGLGLPIPLRSLSTVRVLAKLLLPVITRLPFTWLYPTGKKQEETTPRYPRYFHWADVIAGDFHLIRRYLPKVDGKTVITNTVTSGDVQFLRERGIRLLITTTPEMEGRSFGTNVIEALCVAIKKKPPEEMTAEDYDTILADLGLAFRIEELFSVHEKKERD